METTVSNSYTQPRTLSVSGAAKRMRCSQRTVLNRIENKEIIGEKPGRDWVIDFDSVKAFCLKRGITLLPEDLDPEPAAVTAPTRLAHDSPTSKGNSSLGPRRVWAAITVTAAFRLFNEANAMIEDDWENLEPNPGCRRSRIRLLQLQAIEHLGAGFYSYGDEKLDQYNRARGSIGSIAALIHSHSKATPDMRNYLMKLENDVIPAIRSLILYINKPANGKRNHERSRGGEA